MLRSELAGACSSIPSSRRHNLYLVGGIAVPNDELSILGCADQQPVENGGERQRGQGTKPPLEAKHPSLVPMGWEALWIQLPTEAQRFLTVVGLVSHLLGMSGNHGLPNTLSTTGILFLPPDLQG